MTSPEICPEQWYPRTEEVDRPKHRHRATRRDLGLQQVVPVKGCNVRRQTDLGGQPLAGVNDSGCNTVTFRITGKGFVSSNLDMLFGTS